MGTAPLSQGAQWHCCCPCPLLPLSSADSRGLCTNTSKGDRGDSPRADPGLSFLPLLLHQVELSHINKQWWQCKLRFKVKRTKRLKSSCVHESRSWVKKNFPASFESGTETARGTYVIWGRGWDRMEAWFVHFQHKECWLFPVPASVLLPLQPLGMTTLSNTGLLDYWVVSKSRGHLFPSCSFSRRKRCTKITPYWLTGGLVEGEFLSLYKLCTVKYIIYFLRKSISPLEYVPHGPGKKFQLESIAAVPLFFTLRICFCLFRIFFGWWIENIPRRSYQDYCLQTEKILLLYYWDHEPRSFYRFPQLLSA